MGNRLTHGLGWRGHWLDMLGGSAGKVNEAIGLPAPQGCFANFVKRSFSTARPVYINCPMRTAK